MTVKSYPLRGQVEYFASDENDETAGTSAALARLCRRLAVWITDHPEREVAGVWVNPAYLPGGDDGPDTVWTAGVLHEESYR